VLVVSLFLAAAPTISVAPSADEGLPCRVHRQFVAALASRNVVAPEAFTASFERRDGGWTFRLARATTTALTRELQVPCEEAGAVAALVVERYFAALFLAAPKVAAPTRPPRPSPLAQVPEPVSVDAGVPEPLDAGVPEPLDAGAPEPLDAGLPTPPDAGVAVALDAGVAVSTPLPFLHVVPAVWVAAWWEVLPRLSPALMVAVQLELGRVWRTGLALASGLPLEQRVTIDETRSGSLVAWSSLGVMTGGACARFERTAVCGDAVIGLRLTSGQATGQLYQRSPALVVMPTAGLRAELVVRLTSLLSLSGTVSALMPWGRSTLQVEGTSSVYATPPVDVLAGLGLSLSL
jgi:hypothetical protein